MNNDELSEQRLRDFAEAASDWFWETDAEGRYVWFSDNVERVTGVPAAWHYGKTREELGVVAANPQDWEQHRALIAARKPYRDVEFLRQAPDGLRWIRSNGVPVLDQQGAFVGYRGTGADITAIKQAQLAAAQAQQRLLTALEAMTDLFALFGADERLVLCNQRYRTLHKNIDIQPGMRFSSLLRAVLKQGMLEDARGQEARWYRQRLRRFRNADSLFELRYSGAVWLEVRQQRMPDGGLIIIATDISARKRAEQAQLQKQQALSNQSNLLRTILENIDQGVIVVDHEMRLLASNQRYRDIMHLAEKGFTIGTPVQDIIDHASQLGLLGPGSREAHRALWTQRIKEAEPYGLHVQPNGHVFEIHRTAMRGGGVVVTYTDVTRFKETERELIAAREASEQITRLKSEFLANMSHEIRTPLHGIMGTTDLLLRTSLQEQQRHNVEVISRSGETLLHLIDDILDFSKIEAGKVAVDNRPFDLQQLLQDCMTLFAENATRKALVWQLDAPAELPNNLKGDALRLRQIITNLLANAIKFTDQGRICCTVRQLSYTGNQIWLRFSISDTGIGITATKIPQLFDYFSQLDSTSGRRYVGTGLGLVISKKLVQLMGGNIGVHSVLGEGSEFWFELPFEHYPVPICETNSADDNERIEHTEVGQKTPANSSATLKILLVEDNPINRELAQIMLTNLGYQCVIAQNGEEALQQLAQQSFDILLMDCQMPIMDGFTATGKIRQQERQRQATPAIPIIALTANAFKEDQAKCLAAGMNDVLAKPFTQQVLQEIVERWRPRLNAVESAHSPMLMETTILDKLWSTQSEPPAGLLKHFIQLYQQQSRLQLQQLKRAAAEHNYQQLGDIAHLLKSTSAQFGLLQLAALCQSIETQALNETSDQMVLADLVAVYDASCERLQQYFMQQNLDD